MKVFTYKDYIDCIHKLRLNAIFQVAEESASYDIGKEPKKKSIIKMILEYETTSPQTDTYKITAQSLLSFTV